MLMPCQGLSSDRRAAPALGRVERASMGPPGISAAPAGVDRDSRIWLERLRGAGPERDAALTELHALLLRAARFEVARRHATSAHLRGGDQDDLAQQSADDALVAILAKLDDFRGESRFTTWAYKFAMYEAGAKVRKRAWQGLEIPLRAETWPLIADDHQRTIEQGVESAELLAGVQAGIEHELTPHQREVLVAIALNDVPIVVNTMPEQTLRAFADHGDVTRTLDSTPAQAEQTLADAAAAGIDLDAVTAELEREGVRSATPTTNCSTASRAN